MQLHTKHWYITLYPTINPRKVGGEYTPSRNSCHTGGISGCIFHRKIKRSPLCFWFRYKTLKLLVSHYQARYTACFCRGSGLSCWHPCIFLHEGNACGVAQGSSAAFVPGAVTVQPWLPLPELCGWAGGVPIVPKGLAAWCVGALLLWCGWKQESLHKQVTVTPEVTPSSVTSVNFEAHGK